MSLKKLSVINVHMLQTNACSCLIIAARAMTMQSQHFILAREGETRNHDCYNLVVK